MSLLYKIDVLQALKDKGYNTNKLRKERLLSESTIQKLRECKPINWQNIAQLCSMLDCQPGDVLEYVPDAQLQAERTSRRVYTLSLKQIQTPVTVYQIDRQTQ